MSKPATVNNNLLLAQDAARDLATAARALKEAGRALAGFMRKCDQMMETCGKVANDDAAIVGLDAMWFDLKKIGCATDLASVADASTALATETAPCLEEASRILQKLVEWQRHVDATPELKKEQSAKERAADEGLAVVSALAVTTEALGRNYGNHGTRVGNAGKQIRAAKGYVSQFVTTPYADFNKQVKARMRAIKASAATSSGSLGLNGSTSGPGLPLSPMTANRGPLSAAAAGMSGGTTTMSAGPLSPPVGMSPMSSAPVSVRV